MFRMVVGMALAFGAVGLLLNLSGLIVGNPTDTKPVHERDWVEVWCVPPARVEVTIPGLGGRVDCVTETHAVEVDWASKWAEAIGQALYYGAALDRTPGIALVLKTAQECRFVPRLRKALENVNRRVDVYLIGEGAKSCS